VDGAAYVGWTIAHHFDKLPENVRNLLFKIFENGEVPGVIVAWAVAHNFDKLPGDLRNKLLLKLSENGNAAIFVAFAVARNFDKLPDSVRHELLFKLSEKDKAARAVAGTVAHNFDKLPEGVRNLLDKLQKPLQQVIADFSRSEEKETALFLITNALPKLNRDFVLNILKELSECEDETVRIRAAKMLKDIFDAPEGKKEY
jgi:Mg/Co/Ni transporter MgtE